ncbi:flavin reductase family protein [Micromonospora sp. NPDC007271]|uniref:flavin reductase family protein n=1 Tax=Micromonospora sp. NPDC007271 TaxID=3154587 RepID=UPI0033F835AF
MSTLDRPAIVELRPVDQDSFRDLLRRQAATVTVVTAPGLATGRRRPTLPPAGCTATALTAESQEPPLVSVRLGRQAASWPALAHAEHLAVHLLSAGQPEVADLFTFDATDPFAVQPDWASGPFGVPLIRDARAVLLCRVVHTIEAGDHTVVLGEPLALGTADDERGR